jgi:1,4-alpha-glucan branching enzyme
VILPKAELAAFLAAKHATPHDRLGMHPYVRGRSKGVVVRALVRGVAGCEVVELASEERFPMTRLAPEGFFEVFIPQH